MRKPTAFSGRIAINLLIVAMLPTCALGGTEAPREVIPIAMARDMPTGTVVTVRGVVSTPPGAFYSSASDQGFGVQDRSAGLYVSASFTTTLRQGNTVTVTGMLADSAGLRVLIPKGPTALQKVDKTDRESSEIIKPSPMLTGAVGGANQGSIVRVRGRPVDKLTADLPYGYEFHVDDGSGPVRIYINLTLDLDVSNPNLTRSTTMCVTGFSGAYDTPEIDIRGAADLRCD